MYPRSKLQYSNVYLFQTRDEVYSNVGSLVAGTDATVQALRSNPGEHYKNLKEVMEELVSQPYKFRRQVKPKSLTSMKRQVFQNKKCKTLKKFVKI